MLGSPTLVFTKAEAKTVSTKVVQSNRSKQNMGSGSAFPVFPSPQTPPTQGRPKSLSLIPNILWRGLSRSVVVLVLIRFSTASPRSHDSGLMPKNNREGLKLNSNQACGSLPSNSYRDRSEFQYQNLTSGPKNI